MIPFFTGPPCIVPPVTVRTYRGRQVGTADEAGKLCTTRWAPDGVKADTYQYYVKRLGAPDAIRWRDPDTGAKLYDLGKVTEWNAGRAGRGARTDLRRRKGSRGPAEGDTGAARGPGGPAD